MARYAYCVAVASGESVVLPGFFAIGDSPCHQEVGDKVIWCVENEAGERAIVGNMAGWDKLLGLGIDARVNRFRESSHVVLTMPVGIQQRGRAAAMRLMAKTVGAIYPADSEHLAIVDDGGKVLAGLGNKIDLARLTGTSRATIWGRMAEQRPLTGWGWVVCRD